MKTLCLIFFTAFSLHASAQVTFGVRTGLNLNFMSAKAEGVSASPASYKLDKAFGGYAGAFVKIPLNANLSFKPGANIQLRGTGGEKLEQVDLFYSDIPMLLQYNITKTLFIEAGPVVSKILLARVYSLSGGKRNATDSIEPFGIGLHGAMGYQVSSKFAVTATVYSSLTKAWDLTYRDVNNEPNGIVSYFPGSLSLGVEYYF